MEFLLAIFIGFILGLLGGGGSILTVPVLVYVSGIAPILATGYSLFIVGVSSLVGSSKKIISGNFDRNSLIYFGIVSIIGVYLSRSMIVPNIPDDIIKTENWIFTKGTLIMSVFAFFMLGSSIKMIFGRKEADLKSSNRLMLVISGSITGIVAGFVGAGGGFLIVPALNQFANIEMKKAVTTSLIIISVQSLFGFLAGDLFIQEFIDWIFLLKFMSLAISGIFIGIYFSDKISNKGLKKSFGFFVLIMAIFIFFKELI